MHVEGRLHNRAYLDQQEQKRYAAEIIAERVTFLEKAPEKSECACEQESDVPF